MTWTMRFLATGILLSNILQTKQFSLLGIQLTYLKSQAATSELHLSTINFLIECIKNNPELSKLQLHLFRTEDNFTSAKTEFKTTSLLASLPLLDNLFHTPWKTDNSSPETCSQTLHFFSTSNLYKSRKISLKANDPHHLSFQK